MIDSADSFVTTFDTIRMEDIAKASGIPRATLYYYFDGKSEILTFLLSTMLASFSEKVDQVVHTVADTRTRLEAVVRSHLEVLTSSPATAQVLMGNLGQISKGPDLASQVDRLCLDPIRRLLEDGRQRGEIGDIDIPTGAGTIFAAMSIGAITLLVQGTLDIDRFTDDLMGVLWNGVGA